MNNPTERNVNLTKLELAVLKAIDRSEYGDALQDHTWSWSVGDNIEEGVALRSIPGVVASLSKKGLVSCGYGGGDDNSVGMTDAGAKLYVETVGKENVKKWVREEKI